MFGDSQHTQNIQVNHWQSFAPSCLGSSLWCLGSTQVKWKQNKNRKPFDHISACNSLLKHSENVPLHNKFWWVMKSGYWKMMWNGRDYGLTTTKAGLHPKKMLCIWWGWKRLLYYELLGNQMINPNKYCPQLDQIKAALDENHLELINIKCIIFHQDNERPHVSLMTRQKLLQLGWETLIYPPYSLDITPSDFHLFQSLQYSLNGKKSISWKTIKKKFGFFNSFKSFGNMEIRNCLKNGRK